MENPGKNSTFATSPDAIRSMARHLIYELTCDGIVGKGLSFVTGSSVANDLLDQMSCKDTDGLTLARNAFNARNVIKSSCDLTIWPNISRLIRKDLDY